MVPQPKYALAVERTEDIPAQERDVAAGELNPALPAELVYAQRLAEIPFNEDIPGPIFVP
jgi:hypothetical protein